jgi:hypothetical protein
MKSRARVALCLAAAWLLLAPTVTASPDQQEERDEAEKGSGLVQSVKIVGRDLKHSRAGQGARKIGKEVAEVSREGFREIRAELRPAAREVRDATRAAWKELLEVKREAVRELREENKRLQRKLAAREKGR